MRIPDFMNRDDYLQNPIMRRFLKEHGLEFVENRADYLKLLKNMRRKIVRQKKKQESGF